MVTLPTKQEESRMFIHSRLDAMKWRRQTSCEPNLKPKQKGAKSSPYTIRTPTPKLIHPKPTSTTPSKHGGPEPYYVLISLVEKTRPIVRAFRISDNAEVTETAITTDGDAYIETTRTT